MIESEDGSDHHLNFVLLAINLLTVNLQILVNVDSSYQ